MKISVWQKKQLTTAHEAVVVSCTKQSLNLMWFTNLTYPGPPHSQSRPPRSPIYGLRLMMLSCAGVCRKQRVATTSAARSQPPHPPLLRTRQHVPGPPPPNSASARSEQSGARAGDRAPEPEAPAAALVNLIWTRRRPTEVNASRPHLPATRSPPPASADRRALHSPRT